MAMSADGDRQAKAREALSSLMDGELDRPLVTGACEQWRRSAPAREAWYAYHLIGDALRSDDLAAGPSHDLAFLDALRARLADEPVVLAPAPPDVVSTAERRTASLSASRGGEGRRRSWLAGSAIAAGFMAVAGVLVVTRAPAPADERVAVTAPGRPEALVAALAPRVAALDPAASASMQVDPSEPQAFVANPQLIRSARLDRYLSAHQQFAGSSALGMPSGFVRHATADAAAR